MRRLGTLALAASLATSLLVPAAAAAAPDDEGQERFRSLSPPAVAPSQMPLGEGTEEREYFVRLAGDPAALYTGGVEGFEATTRMAPDGTLDFQAGTAATRSYEALLVDEQTEVLTDGAEATIGRQLEPLASYTVANHGFAALMTPAEARELAELPDVTWVQEFPEYEMHTDRGPAFVGADGPVWQRPEDGQATGTLGEGVVVGVIDTGINPSSPSFAEESADGYVHENPRDRSYGSCDPTNVPGGEGEGVVLEWAGLTEPDGAHYDEDLAELCNEKLIGMWGFNSVTGEFDEDGDLVTPGTPIDYDGHGSHTAGTAAGGFADGVQPASLDGEEEPELTDACSQAPPTDGFLDVEGGDHADNINCIAGYGVAQGRTDGNFLPRRVVNREQMASFVQRMLLVAGVDLPDTPTTDFPDLTGGPHDLAIRQLADVGVVEGRPNGTFNPLGTIRRDQTAALVVRALEEVLGTELDADPAPFTDITDNVHQREIAVAYERGITFGQTPTRFNPAGFTRRDQMASLIARTLDDVALEGVVLTPIGHEPPAEPTTFDVSGVAPRANIISYAACCTGVALISAIDQAIADDVDVINFSIGSTSPTADLLQDALTFGFLVARDHGIHVANSAGNAGPNPGTIGGPSDAPWLTSVAASTHDRLALKVLEDISDGDATLADIEGKGVSGALDTPTELVYAGDHGNELCRWNEEDDPDGDHTWDEDTFDGEIVICDRGVTARVEKSQVAAAAGAAGFVLANDEINAGSIPGSLNGDSFPIPGLHVTYDDGVALKAFVADADVPTATISATEYDIDDRWGDIVAIFSSRGPNVNDASLMAPQVTAPGMDILAPYGSDDSTDYQFISGTSMSGPHVAGALALLVDGFGDVLSASEAQSALQLTARRDVRKTDGETPADPYDVGSGHIDVDAALASGLVMDVATLSYIEAVEEGDTASLNVPSLAQGQCVAQCAWERTFTAPAGLGEVTWTIDTDASGFTVEADQESFTLSGGDSATVTFTADVEGAEPDVDLFGSVELTPSSEAVSAAHLPVVVRPSSFAGPQHLDLVSDGFSGQEDVDFVAANAPDLQVAVTGLAPGEVDDLQVPQDPSPGNPFLPADEVTFTLVDVPEDTQRLVAMIGETTSPDIDLFVGRDDNDNGRPDSAETRCVAASSGSDERCELEDPAPGTYWILVQNWEASAAGTDAVELITAVAGGDEGNLDVDAPASVGVMEPFTLGLEWDLEPLSEYWFGGIVLGSDADNPDEYPVTIDLTVVPPDEGDGG